MENTDNQQVTDYRAELLSRAKSRFPDRNFDDKLDENGNVVESGESLEKAIFDIFTEGDTNNREILDLLNSDPEARTILNHFMRTHDMRRSIASTYGDSIGEVFSEENLDKNAEDLDGWRQRKAETDEMNAAAAENWDRLLDRVDQWGDQRGIDDQRKADIIARLMIITEAGMTNDYTDEDLELVLKGLDYDGAVSGAREEGLVTGRNEQIAERRQSRARSASLPPVMRGNGMAVAENRPQRKKSPWAGIE